VKILVLHNYYLQSGGEDVVVEQEKSLLESRGNQVQVLGLANASIRSRRDQFNTALNTIYSPVSKTRVAGEIGSFKPDIAHIHNFFPLLSPSVYYACRNAGVPVVQTLHNFRLVCPNAMLFRQGKPCELCLHKVVPWPGALHACYRGSRAASMLVASMLSVHRFWGTWNSTVEAYIALTQFSREKLIAGGLPADRLFLKPNFIFPDPGNRDARNESKINDGYALFVGRLAPEKGIRTLLSAWNRAGSDKQLKIVGTGPLEESLRVSHFSSSGVEFLGQQSPESVLKYMNSAKFLVLPSEWYEGFPRVIVEAFAKGLPVLASRLGSMAELVEDQHTGILFRPGDAHNLAEKIEWMFTHPVQLAQMSEAARREFEAKYTAERNYKLLMEIYQYASDNARTQQHSRHRSLAQDPGVAPMSHQLLRKLRIKSRYNPKMSIV
jgi:glycosyltransferase involved in cell wall biosynthesis